MKARAGVVVFTIVVVMGSASYIGAATEQAGSTDVQMSLVGYLPPLFDGRSDVPRFSQRLSHASDRVFGSARPSFDPETEDALTHPLAQARPMHVLEQDVLASRPLLVSRHLHGTLVVFEPDEAIPPTTATTVNKMIEDDDLGIVASVRFSF